MFIKIIKSSNNGRWYDNQVGNIFPLLSLEEGHTEYKTREPSGYINFVLKEHSVIIEE